MPFCSFMVACSVCWTLVTTCCVEIRYLKCFFTTLMIVIHVMLCVVASGHCQWRGPFDSGTSMLWPVGVRGGVGTYQVICWGPGVAWRGTCQWRYECWWVYGAASAVECHSVCLLYACWRERVYRRVSYSYLLVLHLIVLLVLTSKYCNTKFSHRFLKDYESPGCFSLFLGLESFWKETRSLSTENTSFWQLKCLVILWLIGAIQITVSIYLPIYLNQLLKAI